jgi:formamidopyrimidine-DNA glycosylase
MPELPELEFCGRSLARWTAGRRVVGVEVRDPRSIRASRTSRPTEGLAAGDAAVREVVLTGAPGPLLRHGKRLLWPFGERALLLHLGMTGRWTRQSHPHTKVSLHLSDGSAVHFADPRLLGGIVPTTLAEGRSLLVEGLGPDALREPLPPLPGRRPVKVALMDQAVVAGLGNLHAAEALWRAGIDPRLPAESIVAERHAKLADAVRAQLLAGLELLEQDEEIVYVEDAGAPNPFPLYQRGGEPCARCGAPVAKFTQAGRTTWWCPGCQT